ncbi:hypothetical protein B0T19DRAFT_442194 [Cercophora scortea]|uniref:NAD(P)-binding domain-containing protein n=1 Tax=Cercophora scortea TaxID=314031 RepID=A0AAE0INL8_9PEZI|nr:hypothetical protein B0T19DRAFT_442194 [Cercophora scortea]
MTNTDPPNRSVYAVIGSTGNCGSALIQPELIKLHRILPDVIDNKQLRVFEGSITDIDLMADCIRGTKAVFLVASTNANSPGCRLVLLSSSTIDDHLARNMPWWFSPVMLTAASNVYEDLVPTIFIKPGGLSVDVSRGHRLTLDEEESFVSY